MPKLRKREIRPLEVGKCKSLFAACKDHRLDDAVILSAMTGLRKGEILAQEWSAVNLSEGLPSVRQALEEVAGFLPGEGNKHSRLTSRGDTGDDCCPSTKAAAKKALSEDMAPSEVPFVFPRLSGTLHRGSNFDRNVWHPIREAAGISDDFTFHDLRHTQASLMIAAGVPMKIVQERLGHSDYQVTANTYSHLMQGTQAAATEKADRLFQNVPS